MHAVPKREARRSRRSCKPDWLAKTRWFMPKLGKSSRRRHWALASGAAYQPQQFVITFSAATPYIRTVSKVDDREVLQQDPRYFHVFAHEYWHYWHNVSTTAGMKQFFAMQDLVALFTRTLTAKGDGTSLGADALGDDRRRVIELARISANVQGQGAPREELGYDLDVAFTIDDAYITTARDTYNSSELVADEAVLEMTVVTNGVETKERMCVGAIAIEEGVALLVEEHCAERIEDAMFAAVRKFPYRVLPAAVDRITGRRCSSFAIAALGTLALHSSHPGPALFRLAEEFGNRLDGGLSEPDALDELIADGREDRMSAATAVGRHMEGIVGMHQERGAVELAVKYLQAQSAMAFQFRVDYPVADLAMAFNDDPIRSLDAHIKRFPPCDVLQMQRGSNRKLMRDGFVALHAFEPLHNGLTLSDCMRSLQAQQDYLAAHSDAVGQVRDSKAAMPHQCPYFTSCNVGVRITTPRICATRPWKALDRASDRTCWYGGGVAATLGPVIASGLGSASRHAEGADSEGARADRPGTRKRRM